jgi:hypothetical protein
VGLERNAENQHSNEDLVPKLILAGNLDATSSGHKIRIQFADDRIVIGLPGLLTAWKHRQSGWLQAKGIYRALSFLNIKVYGQIGSMRPIELFPSPRGLVRFLLPPAMKLSHWI